MRAITTTLKLLLVMMLSVSCQNNLVGTFIKADPNTESQAKSFVSIWKTTTSDEAIQLPLRTGFNYDIKVDWGDGSERSHIRSWNDPHAEHIYAVAGQYTVTISGLAEAWSFREVPASKDKIIEVSEFGDLGLIDLDGGFTRCEFLVKLAGGNVSKVTTMHELFFGATILADLDIANWDTSNVINMSSMFRGRALNPDVSKWNTSNVKDMSYMFIFSKAAKPDVSKWDTSSVENMNFMFRESVAEPDVSRWDTRNVKYLNQTFLKVIGNPDVSNWNTSNVEIMSNLFQGAVNANPNTSKWDFSKTTNLNFIFSATTSLSSDNYSSFLIRLEATSPLVGVRDIAVSAKYNASAATARASLVSRGWRITDSEPE